MAKRRTPPTASDDQVRALLDRYHCPVPFHAVRTRFLGNIASPDMQGVNRRRSVTSPQNLPEPIEFKLESVGLVGARLDADRRRPGPQRGGDCYQHINRLERDRDRRNRIWDSGAG